MAPDEKELVHFYRQMGDNDAMKRLALEQVQKMADAVLQADLEAMARSIE